jgi:hypothetical protein
MIFAAVTEQASEEEAIYLTECSHSAADRLFGRQGRASYCK